MADQSRNQGDETGREKRQSVEIRSKYEFVMAASKEAERLNDHYRKTGASPVEKVTIEASKRIRKGLSRVTYEDAPTASEEGGKDQTYFFGA